MKITEFTDSVIRAFSDVEKPFLFSDLAVLMMIKLPNQKIKQDLSQGQDSSPDSALPIT